MAIPIWKKKTGKVMPKDKSMPKDKGLTTGSLLTAAKKATTGSGGSSEA